MSEDEIAIIPMVAIDSILIGSTYKKHFILDPGLSLAPLEYIEGIGYYKGQGILSNWQFYNIGLHKTFELRCVKEKGNLIYQIANNGPCYVDESTVPSATNNLSKSTPELNIYPSPFNYSTTIEFSNKRSESYTLKLYNVMGELIRTDNNIRSESIVLNKGALTKGIYFINLFSATNTFKGVIIAE